MTTADPILLIPTGRLERLHAAAGWLQEAIDGNIPARLAIDAALQMLDPPDPSLFLP